ncbi:MAG: tetratricopeptide repeat protein [Bacteroidaceae bacterium]|nr:tetratricopeptide repeat protein [Bacteroidaceae bacterium]
MKESDIRKLRERYEKLLEEGTHGYFEPDELEMIADSYEQEMSYRKALHVVSHGLQLYPSNEMLMLHKARCLLSLGRIEDAGRVLAAITEHNIEYHFTAAEWALMRDDDDGAVKSFCSIISDADATIEDCIDVLDICADLDRVELLEQVTPVVERQFDDATPYLRELAMLYEEKEQDQRAIELYNQVLDVNPFSVDDWFSLAKVYARVKEYAKAIEACDFALAIEENDESVIAFKGYCYYDSGEYMQAIEQFQAFLQCTSDKAVAYELIAEAYGRLEKHEQAIEYLLKAVAINDRSHDLYYQLAVNHYYMGDVDEAISYLRKAVACDDSDDEAHVFMGELLLQKDEYEEAYIHLLRTQLTPVVDTVPATALADVCIHLQRYDEAIKVLELLLEQDPYEPHYLFDIILCYLQQGEYQTAAEWVAHSEKLSRDTQKISILDESSRKAWNSIRERIDELRNILSVYLDKKL